MNSAVTPRIKPILAILEPMALPMARSGVSSNTEISEIKISGADVPKPMMVIPMISVDTPRLLAVAAAPSTNRSALQTSRMRPQITDSIDNNMGLVGLESGAQSITVWAEQLRFQTMRFEKIEIIKPIIILLYNTNHQKMIHFESITVL